MTKKTACLYCDRTPPPMVTVCTPCNNAWAAGFNGGQGDRILLLTVRETLIERHRPSPPTYQRINGMAHRGRLPAALAILGDKSTTFAKEFPGQSVGFALLSVSAIEDPGDEALEAMCVEVLESQL